MIRGLRLLLAGLLAVTPGAVACAGGKGRPGTAAPSKKAKATMTYDDAVAALGSPTTWCAGAARLAELDDERALVPIVRAYEIPLEGGDKGCLLKALAALATRPRVEVLFDGGGEGKRIAAHLMELYPDGAFLGRLERALEDGDAKIRRQALTALLCQKQSPAWEALLIKLLDHGDKAVQRRVRQSLERRDSDAVRRALVAHPAS